MSKQSTWTKATPPEMVAYLTRELERTPRWRLFKRLELKRTIEWWESQR